MTPVSPFMPMFPLLPEKKKGVEVNHGRETNPVRDSNSNTACPTYILNTELFELLLEAQKWNW